MKLADLHIGQPDTICDFCSMPLDGNSKLYHSVLQAVIPLEDATLYDDGEWLACLICTELKDGHRWEELLVRATNSLMKLNNVPEEEREDTRERLKEIWKNAFGVTI